MDDLISRQEAIEALQEHRNLFCDNTPETFSKLSYAEKSRVDELDMAIATLINLPSAQPDSKELSFTHKALDTISRQDAIRIVDGIDTWQAGWRGDAIESMKALPTAQPETHEERTETHACDLISRQATIDAHYEYCNKHPDAGFPVWSLKILENLPSVQPEHTNSCYTNSWCIDCKEYDKENKCCPRYNRVIKQTLDDAYRHGETEAEARFHAQQRWIPCSERLPEDIRPVIVTWKNTDPASYYQYIVGKHFTGTACYKNGKWYWYSSTTEDMLAEYGRYDSE